MNPSHDHDLTPLFADPAPPAADRPARSTLLPAPLAKCRAAKPPAAPPVEDPTPEEQEANPWRRSVMALRARKRR